MCRSGVAKFAAKPLAALVTGNALEGISAPALTGDHFLERWREDALDSFYNFIKDNMPPRRPADVRMPDSSYLDIVTYILKMNGYRSGANKLAPDLLGRVTVVGKNGIPAGAGQRTGHNCRLLIPNQGGRMDPVSGDRTGFLNPERDYFDS